MQIYRSERNGVRTEKKAPEPCQVTMANYGNEGTLGQLQSLHR